MTRRHAGRLHPGEGLVAAWASAGGIVVPIPGASSVLAAVAAAGVAGPRWSFEGFLPRSGRERRERLAGSPPTSVARCCSRPEPCRGHAPGPGERLWRRPSGRRVPRAHEAPRGSPRTAPLPARHRRRARPRRGAQPDHDDELAAGRDRPVGGQRGELAERPADDLLVELRELAADGARAVVAAGGREVARAWPRAGRAPRTARVPRSSAAIRGQPLPPLAARPRQEPLERPARPRDARRGDRREDGRRARDRHHDPARRRPRRDQPLAGVGHDRRPGIGHQREVGAAARGARAAPARAPGRSGRGSSPSGS